VLFFFFASEGLSDNLRCIWFSDCISYVVYTVLKTHGKFGRTLGGNGHVTIAGSGWIWHRLSVWEQGTEANVWIQGASSGTRLHNENLHSLYPSANIIRMIESRKMWRSWEEVKCVQNFE
jgi:hypothetical protein